VEEKGKTVHNHSHRLHDEKLKGILDRAAETLATEIVADEEQNRIAQEQSTALSRLRQRRNNNKGNEKT
jgi:hypothetical protein